MAYTSPLRQIQEEEEEEKVILRMITKVLSGSASRKIPLSFRNGDIAIKFQKALATKILQRASEIPEGFSIMALHPTNI
jgi:hypothetical protein